MNFIQKLFNRNTKEKSVAYSGGFELLSKLLSPELGTGGLMEQYKKSLYVFACISKISEKIGSIEVTLSQVLNSKGDMKPLVTHPALDLLYRPNKIQTKSEFFATTIINKKTAGDAFWYKVRNNQGKVVELWNLRPDMMTIITDPVLTVAGYKFSKADGTTTLIATEDIVHFKDNPDPTNQYLGVSALMPARVRVQTEEFATAYQRQFFLNSARPDAVLKSTKNLTSKQRRNIKDSWNKKHSGVKNSSKIGLLEGGMEYQLISLTQKDMDFIEGIKLTRDDILVAFRMSKSALGITEDVNRANAETGIYILLSEVIVPEMKYLIEKANEEMLYGDFGENLFYSFVDPTPANRELQLLEYDNGIKNNWLLINEIRQRENLEPVVGGWSFYMPIMNAAMGGLTSAQTKVLMSAIKKDSDINATRITEAKKPKQYDFKGRHLFMRKMILKERITKILIDRFDRKKLKTHGKKKTKTPFLKDEETRKIYADMINKKIDNKSIKLKQATDIFANDQMERVITSLDKVAKKGKKNKFKLSSIFDKKKENAITLEFIVPYIHEFLVEAGLESLETIEPQTSFNNNTARIQEFIKKRASMFTQSVNSTTLDGLDTTLSEGIDAGEGIYDLRKRVEAVYSEFSAYRSELIARTEATAANNEGVLESFKQSSVINGKEWITAGDDRVRPEHAAMEGEIVELNQNFSNGVGYPQEPNCRCVLGGAFIE